VGDLVEDAGLGEGVRDVQLTAVVEGADEVRVEAVEGADLMDGRIGGV
jgi:hypothetical protein